MPHKVHQRKFGRKTGHRKAMLRNLTLSVLGEVGWGGRVS